MGRAAGLSGAALHDVYLAALLRFLGCTAYAHETAVRYAAGEDQTFLRAITVADAARPVDLLQRAARGVSAAPLGARLAALARLSTDAHPADAFARAHCGLATSLSARLSLSSGVVAALGQMYERWDGRGSPARLAGAALSTAARLVILAFRVVTHHAVEGRAAAVEVVATRRGGELDPELADVFLGVAGPVMDVIDRPSVWEAFLAAEPEPRLELPAVELPRVAAAFADYTDLKSPFTLGHSHGVAALADLAAAALGLDAGERARLQLAALLHDLGRVAVPNGIWDKPGALTPIERERVESHAWHTGLILGRSPLFADVAAVATGAHERLDGAGYPRATATATPLAARVLAACDVLHALGEERSHRPAFAPAAAHAILGDEARAGRLDAAVVDVLLGLRGAAAPTSRRPPPDGLTEREVEVLQLLARGLSNKEIAARLEISPKTVQHHVAHIYDKTGVRTRAAAAIYAVDKQIYPL